MIDKNYNPYDIFKRDDVLEHLKDIINKVDPGFRFPISDFVRNSIFAQITGVTNFLGVGFAKIIEIGTNQNLKQYLVEQILYLQKNPQYLGREIRINFILSILFLKDSFAIKEKMGGIGYFSKSLWTAIKSLSVDEGIINYIHEKREREEKEMWHVLRNPITLLFNVLHINNNTPSEIIDLFLSDLINSAKIKNDIDGLCKFNYNSFLKGTIKDYIDVGFDSVLEHLKTNKDSFQTITDEIIDKALDLRNLQLEELKKQDEEEFRYYKNEIKQWTIDYPATTESDNFIFVTENVSKLAKIPANRIFIDSRLDDLNFDENLRKKLCFLFEVEKGFSIDDIYLSKFETIGEIISFWNAFDNNDPINMMP